MLSDGHVQDTDTNIQIRSNARMIESIFSQFSLHRYSFISNVRAKLERITSKFQLK